MKIMKIITYMNLEKIIFSNFFVSLLWKRKIDFLIIRFYNKWLKELNKLLFYVNLF